MIKSPNLDQMRYTPVMVPTSIGKLAVYQHGQAGPVIVLWPSIFTDHRIYDGLVELLSERFRFVLIDGPGHGASGGDNRSYSGQDFARTMLEVMDALGLDRAIIGGTSWGGITGAEAAIAAPDRVKALVLMNTPMTIDRRSPGFKARAISLGARWMLRSNAFRNGVANSFFSAESVKHNKQYLVAFHTMLKNASPKALSASVRSVIVEGEPLMDRLHSIGAPTLVVAGKHDDMYPLAVQAEAALRLPNGYFEVVNSRHISVVDAPDAVADALVKFIDERACA